MNIVFCDNHIAVYGIKLLSSEQGIFTYEGILFDKFPEVYQTLYVTYINKDSVLTCSEIVIVDLTDTKIVFQTQIPAPEHINNILIEWM